MLTFSALGRSGRFANGLFQIASTIGIAERNNYAYGFPRWMNHDHKDRFGSTEDIDLQKYFVNPLPTIDNADQYPDFPIPWGWHERLVIPDNVSLSGHMQSDKYFDHCIDKVRHYFRMKDEPKQNGCIALHVRLGDYDNNYHPRLGREYYEPALKQFPSDWRIILFSDDPDGAMLMLGEFIDRPIFFPEKGDYISHFKQMKRCGHFITGNSSYSLMAAILGDHPDKKIVCPSNWWGPGWGPNHKELCKDVYPKNAIVI